VGQSASCAFENSHPSKRLRRFSSATELSDDELDYSDIPLSVHERETRPRAQPTRATFRLTPTLRRLADRSSAAAFNLHVVGDVGAVAVAMRHELMAQCSDPLTA
jgi:hypothetical protein